MVDQPVVREVVSAYLQLVDAEAPGLVEGLYLVGSVTLGDFRAEASDIDYLAVTAARPDVSAMAALARVHQRLRRARRRPYFDGAYLTWDDLARDPVLAAAGPGSHEGRFATQTGERGPVEWHTLARHGVAVRGPAPTDLTIWADPAGLARWTDHNLDQYWRRLVDRCSRPLSRAGEFALTRYAAVWIVTGVTRLHYTLATGGITSKAGAARYALATFPARWHRVIEESLRIRTGESRRSRYSNPFARRRDVLAYARMVIDDAHRVADYAPASAHHDREPRGTIHWVGWPVTVATRSKSES